MIVVILSFLNRRGMALYPFILLKNKSERNDPVLLNHERIHLRQQIELLILPFYIFYLINYLYHFLLTFQHDKAYRSIIFEREAYSKEADLGYLVKRKFLAFLNF